MNDKIFIDVFQFDYELILKWHLIPLNINKLLIQLPFDDSLFLKGCNKAIITRLLRDFKFKNPACSYAVKILDNRDPTMQPHMTEDFVKKLLENLLKFVKIVEISRN